MKSSVPSSSSSAAATSQESRYYKWKTYRCAYEIRGAAPANPSPPPLLLVHPIGVGLDRAFWHRFCDVWQEIDPDRTIYNPDLLGCGDSDMPPLAYRPQDWAEQLLHFIETVIQQPIIVVAQGALMPVALELALLPTGTSLVRGLIFSGPPSLVGGDKTGHDLAANASLETI